MHAPRDVASIRLDNALALFDEFVRNTIKHPDAATLRGLERRFAERLQIQMVSTPPYKGRFTREIVDDQLRRFYYDTAQVANAVTIGALAKLVSVSQIVFGTDYPYRSGAEHAKGIAANFSAGELKAIDRENVLRILPRLRTA